MCDESLCSVFEYARGERLLPLNDCAGMWMRRRLSFILWVRRRGFEERGLNGGLTTLSESGALCE